MSEDLRTDHVKLESLSILTKNILFCPAIGGGALPPPIYASATIIVVVVIITRTVTRGNPLKLSVNYCRTNTRKNFLANVL